MDDLTDFTDPTPDLTNHEKKLLRRAGASVNLIEVCETSIDGLTRSDGKAVTRHSPLKEVKKYLRRWEMLDDESAEDFTPMGGGFFTRLWDGELYEAYRSADPNNKAIMIEAFGAIRINRHCPRHGTPVQG